MTATGHLDPLHILLMCMLLWAICQMPWHWPDQPA